MAATGRETTITLPPPEPRPRGLLVDVAFQITPEQTSYQGKDRLGQGVQHVPWGCEPLRTGNADCNADYIIDNTGPGSTVLGAPIPGNIEAEEKTVALLGFDDIIVHPAFKIVDGLKGSTLCFPDDDTPDNASMSTRLLRRMQTLVSEALATELTHGWASGGPSLSSEAVTLAASAGIDKAAIQLEEHLAETMHGNRGVIHIPPALLHLAMNAGWIRIEDDQLYTVSGHRVIADAGYLGDLGPTIPGANAFWVYASGDIAYRVSDARLLGEDSTLDIGTNVRERLAEAYAQIAFDPCPVGATLVTIT